VQANLSSTRKKNKRTVEKSFHRLCVRLLIGANGISDPIIYLTRVSVRVRVSFSISLNRRCTATAKPMTLLKPKEKSPLLPPCCGSAISVVSSDPVPVSDPKLWWVRIHFFLSLSVLWYQLITTL